MSIDRARIRRMVGNAVDLFVDVAEMVQREFDPKSRTNKPHSEQADEGVSPPNTNSDNKPARPSTNKSDDEITAEAAEYARLMTLAKAAGLKGKAAEAFVRDQMSAK